MPRRILPLGFLVFAIVVSACSSSPTSSAEADASEPPTTEESAEPEAEPAEPVAGTDLNACEIVTPEDIEAAVGLDAGTVDAAESEATPTVLSPGHSSCNYTGDDWGGVVIELTPEDGVNLYDAARGAYDDASDMVIETTDGAFWSKSTARAFVWKGTVTVMYQIGFLTDGGADRRAIAEALGQAIVDKLS